MPSISSNSGGGLKLPHVNNITNKGSMSPGLPEKLRNVFKDRHICGDIFGSSTNEQTLLGLMYRSRMHAGLKEQTSNEDDDRGENETAAGDESIATIEIIEDSDDELEVGEELNARQQLAFTIQNWSKNSQNDDHILKEGAVQALIALAGVDDVRIRKWCAFAFANLASRPQNREQLIKLGAITGIVTIALHITHWSIAKACTRSLSYLSMQTGVEAFMAEQGAYSGIQALMHLKGNRMLPVCVTSMYNLTCVDVEYPVMERILKSMLTLTQIPNYDPTDVIVKCLVNCSRFENLRIRVIEDGAISFFISLVNSIGYHRSRDEIIYNIVRCLWCLSETKGCRQDMISKGSIELLKQVLNFCSSACFVIVAKILRNLLEIVKQIPTAIFEVAVNVAIGLLAEPEATQDEVTMQYVADCLYIFTMERMRGNQLLVEHCIKNLPKLLRSSDQKTQFFSIAASGNLFFNSISNNDSSAAINHLDKLLKSFIEAGANVSSEHAIRAFAVAIAKMTKENNYMSILEQLGLLPQTLHIALELTKKLPDDELVQESACIASCSLTLRLGETIDTTCRQTLASLYTSLLQSQNRHVLENVISSIRALISKNICASDLISEEIITRLATINNEYGLKYEAFVKKQKEALSKQMLQNEDENNNNNNNHESESEDLLSIAEMNVRKEETRTALEICKVTCAVVTVASYSRTFHPLLIGDDILDLLCRMTNSDDAASRELAAIGLCNLSVNCEMRVRMVEKGMLEVLSKLSGAASEVIQDLASRCISNLTSSVEVHEELLKRDILNTVTMIALVRAVDINTKRTCARSYLNLLTPKNIEVCVSSGVARSFASLSTVECARTRHICARGFLILSSTSVGRKDLVSRRQAQLALFNLVHIKQVKTLVVVGKAVCNLLACPESCVGAIHAGALQCLKVIASVDHEDLRECSMRVLLNLCFTPAAYLHMSKEPLVECACMVLFTSTGWGKTCAVLALLILSQLKAFRRNMVQKNCISALVSLVLNGRAGDTFLRTNVLRCVYNLSFTYMSKHMVLSDHALLLLHGTFRDGQCSSEDMLLITLILRNITSAQPSPEVLEEVCTAVINQDVYKLLRDLVREFAGDNGKTSEADIKCRTAAYKAAIVVLKNMGQVESLHVPLVEQGFMEMCSTIALTNGALLSPEDVCNVVLAIDEVSRTATCRGALVGGGAANVFRNLLPSVDDNARQQMAASLAALASTEECRETLVEQGANQLILDLSNTSNRETQRWCSLAISSLSEITYVSNGTVGTMKLLTESIDADAKDLLSLNSNELKERNSERGMLGSSLETSSIHSNEGSPEPSFAMKEFGKLRNAVMHGDATILALKQNAADLNPKALNDTDLSSNLEFGSTSTAQEYTESSRAYDSENDMIRSVLPTITADDINAYLYSVITHEAAALEVGMANSLRIDVSLPTLQDEPRLDVINKAPLHQLNISNDSLNKILDEPVVKSVDEMAKEAAIEQEARNAHVKEKKSRTRPTAQRKRPKQKNEY